MIPKISIGDNVKVIFRDDGRETTIMAKILKIKKKHLIFKFFKRVVYSLKEKINIAVDFTPAIKKVKIYDGMQMCHLLDKFNSETQAWDDGEY